jgi:pimeloyl-ACP methyl ester carboxylesterase
MNVKSKQNKVAIYLCQVRNVVGMLCGVGVLALTGCMTINVSEKNFLQPDSVTGMKVARQFDVRVARQALPEAVVQEQVIKAVDGNQLEGVIVRQADAMLTILYFGGNMFHIDESAKKIVAALGQCKADIAMVDYRGYGRSAGAPNIDNMKSDALQVYDQVRAQVKGRLMVHGRSFGGFIAGYVAQNRAVDGLVLESTATNAMEWAQANVPWYARPFVTLELDPSLRGIDNVSAARAHKAMALVIVGDKDEVTPPQLGAQLFAAFPSTTKKMIIIPEGKHGGLLAQAETMPAYCAFLAR